MAYQPDAGKRIQVAREAVTRDTIVAVATPPGRGGVGVVRLSGPDSTRIGRAIAGTLGMPRHARHARFTDAAGRLLDEGVVIHFASPASYTGEDVVELQGHGGPIVMRELLKACVEHGARIAAPGEFTQRAFLNDRIDLAQAESVADLIDASSAEAARSAARSLTGEFSSRIEALAADVTELRMHVEAGIDFPEEEIDPADAQWRATRLGSLRAAIASLLADARQGVVLRDGLTVVLLGRPNVGKSSLLNALSGEELAIVTPIPGTTRDYVKATVTLAGVPVHLIDTAGLRDATDEIERLGIERSWKAVDAAGAILFVSDSDAAVQEDEALLARLPAGIPIARVRNKVDIHPSRLSEAPDRLFISATSREGLEGLKGWILRAAGWQPHGEAVFMARARHVEALQEASAALGSAYETLALELQAEEFRRAHAALGRISGYLSADDLLGKIFSSFCIGK